AGELGHLVSSEVWAPTERAARACPDAHAPGLLVLRPQCMRRPMLGRRVPPATSRAPYHSGMVRIRLFAALREAAGVPEVEAKAAPLQAILDDLGDPSADAWRAR